jgi:hypothetical protein
MQCGWVEVGAVRPYQRMSLGIDSYLIEQRHVAQRPYSSPASIGSKSMSCRVWSSKPTDSVKGATIWNDWTL